MQLRVGLSESHRAVPFGPRLRFASPAVLIGRPRCSRLPSRCNCACAYPNRTAPCPSGLGSASRHPPRAHRSPSSDCRRDATARRPLRIAPRRALRASAPLRVARRAHGSASLLETAVAMQLRVGLSESHRAVPFGPRLRFASPAGSSVLRVLGSVRGHLRLVAVADREQHFLRVDQVAAPLAVVFEDARLDDRIDRAASSQKPQKMHLVRSMS